MGSSGVSRLDFAVGVGYKTPESGLSFGRRGVSCIGRSGGVLRRPRALTRSRRNGGAGTRTRGTRQRRRSRSASSTRARGRSALRRRVHPGLSGSASSTPPRAPARSTAHVEVTYVDDAGDPAKAVSAASDLIGQGYKIIAGTDVVRRRAPGRAARRAEQGAVHLRPGRVPTRSPASTGTRSAPAGRRYQDVADAASIFSPKRRGKKVVVFAAGHARSAQGNVAAVSGRSSAARAHTVSNDPRAAVGAADLTPFAQQLKNANADLLFVAWAGTTRRRDVAGARAAGRVSTRHDGRHRPRRAGHVRDLRPGRGTGCTFLSHYVYARRRRTR